MLAGFVDARGRAYDVGFRTLRFSLVDDEGLPALMAGEEVRATGSVTASADLLDPREVRFLLPGRFEVTATPRRALLLAAPGLPRGDPPTLFNVSLGLPRGALEHFFAALGGREFLQFTRADVEATAEAGPALDLVLRGPPPGRPTGTARYRLRIDPGSVAREALSAME